MKAAMISVQLDTRPNMLINQIIVNATTIFAPEEMPSTKGPAMGLEKKVCSKKPARLSAPPSSAAIRMRGRRIFQMIFTCVGSPVLVKMIFAISPTEIGTLPILIFSTVIAHNAKSRPRKTAV